MLKRRTRDWSRAPPASSVVRPVQPVEALGEIRLQVLDVLQPDMDAQDVLAVGPRHGGAIVAGMGGDHQALVAAPRGAHAEDVHAVEHGGERTPPVTIAPREGGKNRPTHDNPLPDASTP